MSLYISTLMANEHRNELIREAAAYRAYRLARTGRRAESARRKAAATVVAIASEQRSATAPSAVYCSRAASFNSRNASRPGTASLGGAA